MKHFIYKHAFWLLMAAILLAVIVNGQSDKPRMPQNEPYELCCYTIIKDTLSKYANGSLLYTYRNRSEGFADTPKLKVSRFQISDRKQSPPMIQITATRFYITDSSRIVAERDSSGKWTINNPERAIEVAYQIFVSQKKDDPAPAGKEEIRYGSIWESNYGNTYIYDARWNRVADRNSSGKWEIIDAAKTLEIFYQIFIKDKRRF